MSEPKLIHVRVLPHRLLSLPDGTTVFEGHVVALPADEAKELVAQGFVEVVKK